jgi:septation ring formation regulator EzrA
VVNALTTRRPAKRQRVVDGVKILLDIAKESSDWFCPLKSALGGMNALIKHYEVYVECMAVAHNSHERSQQFEDVKEKIEDLIPHLNRFKQNANAAMANGDQAEKQRLSELSRYVSRSPATPALTNGLRSTLEKIEKRSQELLAKGAAARFIDKSADSGEVVKLIEQLREAITHYQVSENWIVGRAPLTW